MCLRLLPNGATILQFVQDIHRYYEQYHDRWAHIRQMIIHRRPINPPSTCCCSCTCYRSSVLRYPEIRVVYHPVLLDDPPPYESHASRYTELSISEREPSMNLGRSIYDAADTSREEAQPPNISQEDIRYDEC